MLKKMGPEEDSENLSINTSATGSRELLTARNLAGNRFYPKTEETSVNVDPCAENQICSTKKGLGVGSTTTLHSCSCGPNCGPDKCQGRKNATLVAWDATRTKIFILLIAAFGIWMLIYIPISVTTQNQGQHSHQH